MVKFNAKANPVPSKTTHNTLIEVAWTLIPVLILVSIAVPSFRLLFLELEIPKADVTIKATGNQWNWTYTYPDDKIEYTSIMLSEEDRAKLKPGAAAAARRRPRDHRSGRQGGAGADHRRRRDPFFRGAGIRHQDRRRSPAVSTRPGSRPPS